MWHLIGAILYIVTSEPDRKGMQPHIDSQLAAASICFDGVCVCYLDPILISLIGMLVTQQWMKLCPIGLFIGYVKEGKKSETIQSSPLILAVVYKTIDIT